MRRLALTISILAGAAGAACAPGSGEFGSCSMTPDCQTKLFCQPGADGGNGVCRYSCQVTEQCINGEICNPNLMLCSKDGGY